MSPAKGILAALPALLLMPAVAVAAAQPGERPPRAVELLELDILRQDLNEITVLDVRSLADYLEGHIPTSFPVDIVLLEEAVLNEPVPDPARVLKVLGDAPLQPGWPTVFYDSTQPGRHDGWAAWLLSYAGVNEVHVLDGGFAAWIRRKRLGVFHGYPSPHLRMRMRAPDLSPRLELRVDPAQLAAETPPAGTVVTVMPAGSQDLAAGRIGVHEVLDEMNLFLYPAHLKELLRSRELDPAGRLLLKGASADVGLVWAALVGNGLDAAIIQGVRPSSKEPPSP